MTIDGAIKILRLLEGGYEEEKILNKREAIKLASEALKRLQVLRSNARALPRLGLPGETKQ